MEEKRCEFYDAIDGTCSPEKEPWESYVVKCQGNPAKCFLNKETGLPKKLEKLQEETHI